ncbi:MAG TPA: hypothetical protein VGZ47_22005 [Gemmataceae bacterium]|jgi:hypothetical protein|nr:hypothetical protein [Gemmataceae bacterium]
METATIPQGSAPLPAQRQLRFNWPVLLLGVIACLAALAVHARALLHPCLYWDDFEILLQSYTWSDAYARLWVPINEHCWPLTRIGTWLVVSAARHPSAIPLATAVQSRLMLILGLTLLYLFVRRELADPFCGLVAMCIFGISASYQEAVNWFAASPALPTVCMALLALLAGQRGRQTGAGLSLAPCAFWSGLAPGWYAGGVLVGPLCCLYLLYPRPAGRIWHALAPLAGTAAFLAVSLPFSGKQIWHSDHYGSQNAWQAFQLTTGLINTGRSLVDNVLLGSFGIAGFTCPPAAVAAGLVVLAAAGVWWWRRTVDHRLFVLGLGFILTSYLLIYSARAGWEYSQIRHWSRYNIFAQLGLALIVCNGSKRFPALDRTGRLSRREMAIIAWLAAILFAINLPRGYIGTPAADLEQAKVFQRLDEIEARCRAHHISAADARKVLDQMEMPGGGCDNPWRFLRGSDDPVPHTEAETRRLLQP